MSRRALLIEGAVAGTAGIGLGLGLSRWTGAAGDTEDGDSVEPAGAVEFYGRHQAGVETPAPARLVLTAFDVTAGSAKDLSALMKEWTLAASRLTAGHPADSADSGESEGLGPSALTLTFGFGPSLFDERFHLGARRPPGLVSLPHFPGEELEDAVSGGDLVVQSCAQDQQVAFHAVRQLARIGSGVVRPRWQQVGFRGDPGPGSTPRNLLGFKDGTVNPPPGTRAFDTTVWVDQEPMSGGTYMCVRRISINLSKWDVQTVPDQQVVIGRVKQSGAPLSGGSETTPLDLEASGPDGVPAIPVDSHIRLAAPQTNRGASMLRRGYSFDDGFDPATGAPDAGTIFLAFVADITAQFVPVQSRLAASDRLNSFTTAVGSATFAVLPGVSEGDYLARTLLG
jgi:deferrochelatase/peroxidase EfeB